MIQSFRHKGLKRLYEKGDGSKLPSDMLDRITEILTALDSSNDLESMNRPTFKFHSLKGNRKDEWAVTVRANWRIVFKFSNGEFYDLNFEDYH